MIFTELVYTIMQNVSYQPTEKNSFFLISHLINVCMPLTCGVLSSMCRLVGRDPPLWEQASFDLCLKPLWKTHNFKCTSFVAEHSAILVPTVCIQNSTRISVLTISGKNGVMYISKQHSNAKFHKIDV